MSASLRCDGLVCAPLSPDHAAAQYEAVVESADALSQWMAWYHPGFGIDDALAWAEWCGEAWSSGSHFEFAVVEESGRYLGACGLGGVDGDRASANLGYWTRTSATGRGVATRAARVVSEWGIRELGLKRVEVMMATQNVASRRVAERAGAFFEGTLRNKMQWGDMLYDACVYSFTPDDFG